MTVLITGGSSGIGFELAKLFAADGYRVVLVARTKQDLDRAAEALRSAGSSRGPSREIPSDRQRDFSPPEADRNDAKSPITIAADLADPAAPKRLIDELAKRQLTVDVLVNNAGFGLLGPFASTDWAKEAAMIQLNVTALTELTKRLLPAMLRRRRGRILNVASVAAFVPGPFMAIYYATKAYLLSFSEALHEELRGTGVTVTTLSPGPVATGFQSRAEIANVGLFSGTVMDATTVARIGYQAMNRDQRLVIPGLGNQLRVFLTRFAPRALLLRLVRSLHT